MTSLEVLRMKSATAMQSDIILYCWNLCFLTTPSRKPTNYQRPFPVHHFVLCFLCTALVHVHHVLWGFPGTLSFECTLASWLWVLFPQELGSSAQLSSNVGTCTIRIPLSWTRIPMPQVLCAFIGVYCVSKESAGGEIWEMQFDWTFRYDLIVLSLCCLWVTSLKVC